jgi:hypothetical protein
MAAGSGMVANAGLPGAPFVALGLSFAGFV